MIAVTDPHPLSSPVLVHSAPKRPLLPFAFCDCCCVLLSSQPRRELEGERRKTSAGQFVILEESRRKEKVKGEK